MTKQPQTPDLAPRGWSPELRHRVAPVLTLLARVRRRRQWQTGLARLLGWTALLLGALAPLVVLVRLDAVAEPRPELLALWAVLALGHIFWQRHPLRRLAHELDARLGGMDALATALWLAEARRRDGWTLVQARAAVALCAGQDPRGLQPWRVPAALPVALGAAVAALVAVHVPLDPVKRQTGLWPGRVASGLAVALPGGPAPFTSAAALLGEDAARLLHVDAAILREVQAQVTDPPTRAWLAQVQNVVDGVADGQVDKSQAMEMLAKLEAERPPPPEDPADAVAPTSPTRTPDGAHEPGSESLGPEQAAEAQQQKDQALRNAVAAAARAAAKAAPKGEEQKLLQEAAEKKDLGLLAKLAEKLINKDMSDKELEQWIAAVEKFAGALKDQKVPDQFKDLAARVDRLQKKRAAEGGLGQSDQERLKSARRELEQLRRTEGDALAAEHQVQRLERGAQSAADLLRRAAEQDRLGQGKESAAEKQAAREELKRQMRAAANELRREDERQSDRQAQRVAQNRLRELREALERTGGQRDQARRQFERRAAGQGDAGDDGGGKGQPGGPAARDEPKESAEARDARKMAEAKRRREGKPGEESGGDGAEAQRGGEEKGGSKGGSFKLGQGKDSKFDRTEAIRQGMGEKGGQRGGTAGSQAGDERGAQGSGEDSGRLTGGKREQLRGQEGRGPDVKKIFSDAAKKGFAREGWRDVYVEYSRVADDMLEQESIPPGRRRVVTQYFESIRPRKGWAPPLGGK